MVDPHWPQKRQLLKWFETSVKTMHIKHILSEPYIVNILVNVQMYDIGQMIDIECTRECIRDTFVNVCSKKFIFYNALMRQGSILI